MRRTQLNLARGAQTPTNPTRLGWLNPANVSASRFTAAWSSARGLRKVLMATGWPRYRPASTCTLLLEAGCVWESKQPMDAPVAYASGDSLRNDGHCFVVLSPDRRGPVLPRRVLAIARRHIPPPAPRASEFPSAARGPARSSRRAQLKHASPQRTAPARGERGRRRGKPRVTSPLWQGPG